MHLLLNYCSCKNNCPLDLFKILNRIMVFTGKTVKIMVFGIQGRLLLYPNWPGFVGDFSYGFYHTIPHFFESLFGEYVFKELVRINLN